ncbi:superfamily II DNA or RNA helicase [Acetoanaerobium pronyense]|uniref:Superfamily II DNA or RNA helicase n=1 Tax=Acetoanaerobium pronyense TaxID=1482736 RepID=A0ABS4KI51_9FIRM|nr:DEAD/DEAH box helicase family protein [Acetoanaerobium pronyense]MBP2027453.1 superfamily II DNA or RNA helicase [Acetoanaerobium pronyense]
MSLEYMGNYFKHSKPNILGNEKLRYPQVEAYIELKEYFNSEYDNRNALVVLPTGVGKTGFMAIAPFGISGGRVLIVTPYTTIKNTVIDALNPDFYNNFWLKRNVFSSKKFLPNIIEYNGQDTPMEVLSKANIVILNIQKLQSRLESSLINRVSKDFFDMIIIDEAHHSTAATWVDSVKYFDKAKVLKLTGTPFRTDRKEINGELIYKYPLSRAMANGYVKSLRNNTFIPDELRLTIDKNTDKTYSIQELYALNLKDMEWITRSVALSEDCSEKIVRESIRLLEKKKNIGSKIPHKIIAVACSIYHAEEIQKLYEKHGYSVALIHSKLEETKKDRLFDEIKNNLVDVIVNVAMLGEGYDHPYLSIAAIFRPFRNELPYAQFVGRILRFIEDGDAQVEDNIGEVIAHKNLELEHLWEKYKIEIQESEIIKRLKDYDDIINKTMDPKTTPGESEKDELGKVINLGDSRIESEEYLSTELFALSKKKDAELKQKIKDLKKILGDNITDDQAQLIIQQAESDDDETKRPDLLYSKKKKNIDDKIREDIVPRLMVQYDIDKDKNYLKDLSIIKTKCNYIAKYVNKNDGILAFYINDCLKKAIGKERKKWTDADLDKGLNILDNLEKQLDYSLENEIDNLKMR